MEDSEVFCRHAFGAGRRQIGKVAVLMERDRTEQYKGAFDRVLHELKGGVYTGVTGLLSGVPVTVIYSKGPADIADCVAYLAMSKTQCRTVFSTGSIGGLGESVGMGDFVVVEDAVGNDGYSRFLLRQDGKEQCGIFDLIVPGTDAVVREVAPLTASAMKGFGGRVHRGRIFTTPGVTLEDDEFLKVIVAHGAIAIDMETAQFYAACRKYGLQSAAFHWVTDLPLTRSFYHRFKNPAAAQADWGLKHPIWLNMAKIVTDIVRGYVQKVHGDDEAA